MGFFDGLKRSMIEAMQQSGAFAEVHITEEYLPLAQESPLKKRVVCVGFEEIRSAAAGAASYIGPQDGDGGEVYGREMEALVSFRVYVPAASGGIACHEVFSRLADYLLLTQNSHRVQSLRCGEISFCRSLSAYTLTAVASIKTTAISAVTGGAALEDIVVLRSKNP